MTHYLIYKITNNINGKIYIGQHQTDNLDDGYMGSGQNIKRAINKYGVKNFAKEILYYCTGWETMNNMEEIIVDNEFVDRKDTYNLRLGGSHGSFSDETKRKLSESCKGRPSPNKGKHLSEETRRKISEAHKGMKGYHHSKETRKKMSDAAKGHFVSEETKQKIGKYHRGKIISDEQKLKISHALKGRKLGPHSEEHNRKNADAHRGKKHSDATKQKMSEARKRYWAERKGVA